MWLNMGERGRGACRGGGGVLSSSLDEHFPITSNSFSLLSALISLTTSKVSKYLYV